MGLTAQESNLLYHYSKKDWKSVANMEFQFGLYDDSRYNLSKMGYSDEKIDAIFERLSGREGQALKIEVGLLKKLEKEENWLEAGKIARDLGLIKRANKNFKKIEEI